MRILALLSLLLLATACSFADGATMLICGQNLAAGYSVPFLVDATASSTSVPDSDTGDVIFVRLTGSCRQGVTVSFQPASAANVLRAANAGDGHPAAVVVHADAPAFVMTIQDGDSPIRTVTFGD